jgi:hypothetical protein
MDDFKTIYDFYFRNMQFCGCGNPESALISIRDVLRIMKDRSEAAGDNHGIFGNSAWDTQQKRLKERFHCGEFLLFLMYSLDAWGLTEHGGSVYGAWLEPEGERLLEMLERIPQDEWLDEPEDD